MSSDERALAFAVEIRDALAYRMVSDVVAMVAERDAVVSRQAADKIEAMCHWKQSDPSDADHVDHYEFHFGCPCPYDAMAAVLRGEPDPR